MLEKVLLGKPLNKSEHRQALSAHLSGRSDGSIEFKHANISAGLAEQGLPYLEGYKPWSDYQALLAQSVEALLDLHPTYLKQLAVVVSAHASTTTPRSEGTLSRELRTPPLPATQVPIGYP